MITTTPRRDVVAALTALLAIVIATLTQQTAAAASRPDGIVRVRSAFTVEETIQRLKSDIDGKGIKFFGAINQSELGQSAGIKLHPSTLLLFGNPPLGIQFLTANPNAGLDWPVRLLVTEDEQGRVWATYTDFAWIARRHGIKNRDAQFKMASEVIKSITSSVTSKR